MRPLFVDTGALAALVHRGDQNHSAAKRFMDALKRERRPLFTSTYVIDEFFTLLRVRCGHAVAVKAGEEMLRTRWCHIVDVTDETRAAAWQIFVKYADQVFSFTDCTSFALLREQELSEAFTFDRDDYAPAGFTPLPHNK